MLAIGFHVIHGLSRLIEKRRERFAAVYKRFPSEFTEGHGRMQGNSLVPFFSGCSSLDFAISI